MMKIDFGPVIWFALIGVVVTCAAILGAVGFLAYLLIRWAFC